MSELPKTILVADIAGLGLCVGDVEGLGSLANDAGMDGVSVGRYKLVGTGKVHQYVDYVEDGEQE